MVTFVQWLQSLNESEFKHGDAVEFEYQGNRLYRGHVGTLGVPDPEGFTWVEMPKGDSFYVRTDKLAHRTRPIEDFREIDLHVLDKLKPAGTEPHGSRQLGTSNEESDLDVKVANIGLAVSILTKLGYSIEKMMWGARATKGGHQVDLFQKK